MERPRNPLRRLRLVLQGKSRHREHGGNSAFIPPTRYGSYELPAFPSDFQARTSRGGVPAGRAGERWDSAEAKSDSRAEARGGDSGMRLASSRLRMPTSQSTSPSRKRRCSDRTIIDSSSAGVEGVSLWGPSPCLSVPRSAGKVRPRAVSEAIVRTAAAGRKAMGERDGTPPLAVPPIAADCFARSDGALDLGTSEARKAHPLGVLEEAPEHVERDFHVSDRRRRSPGGLLDLIPEDTELLP
jgi:hypothetical protein